MSDGKNATIPASFAAAGAVIAVGLIEAVTVPLLGEHPSWLRIAATAVVAGVLAVAFALLIARVGKSSHGPR